MPSFRYRAVSRAGELLSGQLDAADRAGAVARLQALGHVPVAADPIVAGSLRALLSRDLFRSDRLTSRSLSDLMQQLATLVGAGITVEEALALLTGRDAARSTHQVAAALLRRLRDGGGLADAMAAESRIFPPIAVAMVRAGEQSGALESTLARLSEYLRRSEMVRQSVRSALVYPAILITTAFLSILVLLTFVLPQLEPLFRDAGSNPPLPTRLLFGASDAVQDYGWAILLAAGALVLILRRALADPAVKTRRDQLLLRLPILGEAIKRTQAARFARTLGALVNGGVELPRAMAVALPVFSNSIMADAVGKVAVSLREGGGLADPLSRTGLFPELAIQLIRIGQATGKLDEMLLKQADIFDADVQRMIDRGLTLLVPALTILLGIVVAGIIASLMTALLGINDLAG